MCCLYIFDNSYYIEDLDSLNNDPTVAYINHRIEGFALASHEKESKPVVILGINQTAKSEQTQIKNSLINGSFLSNESNGILIGKGLQKIMNIPTITQAEILQNRYPNFN